MADTLGLSVPHLNRVMQHLRKEKLIADHGRVIEFSNIPDLQRLSHYQPLGFVQIPVREGSFP
jgi:hypothetical protein